MASIGIDLGTTHSCVAAYDQGRVEVFENDHGTRTTPYVAFTENDRIVGNEAKNHVFVDPANTVFDTKRLIGRSMKDKIVRSDMKHWPFDVRNRDDKPHIRVKYQNREFNFFAEEIAAMILSKLKMIAEEKLGEEVLNAVITVPAYFNDSQRQATINAARIAKLNVLKLINEPTAAALAFTHKKKDRRKCNVLVFDLGGGTFDVSVLSIENGEISVKAVNGDTHLGGSDFDCRLVNYFIDEIKIKHNQDLKQAKFKNALLKLRSECEIAKKSLSGRIEARVAIASIFDGDDFCASITRAKFEDICDDLFQLTLVPVEKALKDANLEKDEIDEILLVGGSTRIPKVQTLLQSFFNGKSLNKSVNPDEAVAVGAAIQAHLLDTKDDKKARDVLLGKLSLQDVTPLSYGVGLWGGGMQVVIPRNSKYPLELSKTIVTSADFQTGMLIPIYQGERPLAEDNEYVTQFDIIGLPSKFEGEVQVNIIMNIDENGILKVTAKEETTGVKNSIKVTSEGRKLPDKMIKDLISKAERMKKKDEETKEALESRNKLVRFVSQIRRIVHDDDDENSHTKKTRKFVSDVVEKIEQWLKDNSKATKAEIDKEYEKLAQVKRNLKL